MARWLVIGIGNAYRRDDAAGLVAVRWLKPQLGDSVTVLEHSGEGAALLEAWRGAETVILLDAAHSGAAPGTIFRFEANERPLPSQAFRHSTHAFGVAEAIELARVLGELPPRLVVYGIEGKNFTAGIELSDEIATAAIAAARQVLALIQTEQGIAPAPIIRPPLTGVA